MGKKFRKPLLITTAESLGTSLEETELYRGPIFPNKTKEVSILLDYFEYHISGKKTIKIPVIVKAEESDSPALSQSIDVAMRDHNNSSS